MPRRHSKPKLKQIIFETEDKFDNLVYFFLVGGCARIYKIPQRNVPIGSLE
jgi:hypothetical protein